MCDNRALDVVSKHANLNWYPVIHTITDVTFSSHDIRMLPYGKNERVISKKSQRSSWKLFKLFPPSVNLDAPECSFLVMYIVNVVYWPKMIAVNLCGCPKKCP